MLFGLGFTIILYCPYQHKFLHEVSADGRWLLMWQNVEACRGPLSGLLQDSWYLKVWRKLKFWNILSSEIWVLMEASFNGYCLLEWCCIISFTKAASRSCNILLALFEPCTDCKAMEQVLLSHVFTSFWLLMWSLLICFCHFLRLKPENFWPKFGRQGIIILLGNFPEMKWMISMVSNSVTTKEISPFDCSLTPFPYFKQWNRAEWYLSQIFPRIQV